jgi:hypothetical protein
MSAANPNPMEKSMVSLLVVANAGGGVAPCCVVCLFLRLALCKQGTGIRRCETDTKKE